MENDSIRDLLKHITLDNKDQVEISLNDIISQKVSEKFTDALQRIQPKND